MSSKALVSSIMIFLNAEKFIEEAIESIFAQTYDNWEILLVDDGSTDRSTTIALRYAEKYPSQVRYLEHDGHQNRGMSASRNKGISNAKGEYVTFLDSDDIWLPHKLEQQVAILETQPEAVMVYGPTEYWYSWTGKLEDIKRDFKGEIGVQPNTLVKPPTLLILFLQTSGAILPGICSILMRREAIEHIGRFEETFRGLYEDQVFLAKVCLKTAVFVTDECSDKYRQHPDSCCYQAIETGEYQPELPHSARQNFLNWLAKYLFEQGVKNTEIWQALEKELWPYCHPHLYRLSVLPRRLSERVQRLMGRVKGPLKLIGRRTLPAPVYHWLKAQKQGCEYCPPVGFVNFGSLRRIIPISREFGYDRGLPIDRYYIENFLACHADDIRGRVLEIADATYTRRFGGDFVTTSDVLNIAEGNPDATIVGDLTCADHIPSDTFDCVILTQTLHLIYDVPAALRTTYRILKPGGVIIATFPGISQIVKDDWSEEWCWGFTTMSAQRLFEEVFPVENFKVESHGNVLAATAFLQGLAAEELRQEELENCDHQYEVLITVRAVRPEGTFGDQMIDKWNYQTVGEFAYGDDTTYKKGMVFLDGHGNIEDWGCGAAYAKLFVKNSKYIGIDGSQGAFTDKVVDLRKYTSKTDCIFIRHVLEHNHNWSNILANAVNSFNNRMVLIIFTPFTDKTRQIAKLSGIPDISFRKEDLTEFFKQFKYTEESLETDTEYKMEHIFYIEK
jgi:glycosyltransferase involved in cell wall biosynthesis